MVYHHLLLLHLFQISPGLYNERDQYFFRLRNFLINFPFNGIRFIIMIGKNSLNIVFLKPASVNTSSGSAIIYFKRRIYFCKIIPGIYNNCPYKFNSFICFVFQLIKDIRIKYENWEHRICFLSKHGKDLHYHGIEDPAETKKYLLFA